MAARSTWAGAITFAGFPIPVQVFTVVKSRKSASFKMLDPVHKMPVSQILVDCEGDKVERAETLKGVEASKGTFVALGDDALELIENQGRSTAVEVERFAAVASIDFSLSLESYVVIPDPKVPGSEQPVQILWNGLRESQRAAVIPEWAATASAKPSTLVIRATGDGLAGSLLPFGSELKTDLPVWVPVADERAGQTFAAVVAKNYSTEDYDISVYKDGKAERREAAIALALSGAPIPAEVKQDAAPAAVPDLMAALEAQLAAPPAAEAVVA
jgi:Ku protein